VIAREDIADIAVLRLAHGKVSALDVEFCAAIVEAVGKAESDGSRALILAGTGSSFSAGVDLFRVLNGGRAYLDRFLPAMQTLFRSLLNFSKPLVAAVNGHAIAGGCIMAATCDYRVMAEGNGRIGIPELAVGVPFPMLPFEIVRARVSPKDFRDLVLSGRTVLGDEALRLGLVDELAPSEALVARARSAAERLATIPSITFALTKRTFAAPILKRAEEDSSLNAAVIDAWSSDAVQNRVRAYLAQTVGKK
jgi:enoyl-CoA hydratase